MFSHRAVDFQRSQLDATLLKAQDHDIVVSLLHILYTNVSQTLPRKQIKNLPDFLPESDPKKWWVGLGPLSRDEAAIESARDLAGPFLLDKRHPLLEGIVLEGVVW